MSRYERMDCIKRSMMPVRYKKIGSGETYLLLETLFFTSAEPVDKKRKKQAREAWGMGGASTGLRKWISLSFACNSGNGEGMDMERWGGRLFE